MEDEKATEEKASTSSEAIKAEVKQEQVSPVKTPCKDESGDEAIRVKTEVALSAAEEASGEMDEAAMRRALQEYMTMAQTVQTAQQMALATALINAYGSQAVAYLQAAAVTGKPLASMLSSLAMLQQAQQQQQQQQQVSAAALAMLPKRGRGSRGGSATRQRGGVGLKLKRLDS
jgi:hypothetical protein